MKKRRLNSQGQVLIEAVLLLTLVVGMWSVFSKYAKEKKWFDSMVNGPWQSMSGMIETGLWKPPQQSRPKHPNNFNRVVSLSEGG
jgi:hypothetical protein